MPRPPPVRGSSCCNDGFPAGRAQPARISPFRHDAATNCSLIAADLRRHKSAATRYVACARRYGRRMTCLRDSSACPVSTYAHLDVQTPLFHYHPPGDAPIAPRLVVVTQAILRWHHICHSVGCCPFDAPSSSYNDVIYDKRRAG